MGWSSSDRTLHSTLAGPALTVGALLVLFTTGCRVVVPRPPSGQSPAPAPVSPASSPTSTTTATPTAGSGPEAPAGVQDPVGKITYANRVDGVGGEVYGLDTAGQVDGARATIALVHHLDGREKPVKVATANVIDVYGATMRGHGFQFSCLDCHKSPASGLRVSIQVLSRDGSVTARLGPVGVGDTGVGATQDPPRPPGELAIPSAIAARMRPPQLDWTPPAFTSAQLPSPSLVIEAGQSLSGVNDVSEGQLVEIRGDHSSQTLTLTKPIAVRGTQGATVKGIDIEAPCIVTGFNVVGRQVGIFAQGVSGTARHPFIIEGCHCYWNVYGLRLYRCNDVTIKNNLLESNSEIELHVERMQRGTIVGNDLGDEKYHPGGGSVDVDGAALRWLTDCVFEGNYIGEHYYGTRWYSSANCIIRNNVYRNSGSNLRLGKEYGGGEYGQCDDMQVIGNDIQGGTDSIWAQACIGCVFKDNVLRSKYPFPSGMGRSGSGSGNLTARVVPWYG